MLLFLEGVAFLMQNRVVLAVLALAVVASGCLSQDSERQTASNLPLAGESSAPTPLPPTYVVILDSPAGFFKDNETNEWFIDSLSVRYRADDYASFNPLFDVYIEKDGKQVFNRLGVPGDAISKGYFTENQLKLWKEPVFVGYSGDVMVRVQMRPVRGAEVRYSDEKTFSLK